MQFWFITTLFCYVTVFLAQGNDTECTCEDNHNDICELEEKLNKLVKAPSPTSCKEIYDNNVCKEDKPYNLTVGSEEVSVYCHMTEITGCGEGGWTLVMKIDGSESTFLYESDLWSNKEAFNPAGGETGFDTLETKLPTYWNTPFSKICLGMKIDQQLNFIVINMQADSLYSLIADGKHRATSLGRDTWKTLIGSQASLQTNCNQEGFNNIGSIYPDSRARIGLISNNEDNCGTPDSRIGFGTGGEPAETSSCGNAANGAWYPDNGGVNIVAIGYILVQ